MAGVFFHLSANDRRDALEVAASVSGRPVHLLEKDVWIVWSFATLFAFHLRGAWVIRAGCNLFKNDSSKSMAAIGARKR